MRKIFLSLLAASLLMSSAYGQEEKDKVKAKEKVEGKNDRVRIEGSGNVITKEFPVKSFDELSALGVFNLQLSQGDKESLKIEAEDNLMDLFIVENEGSVLKVHMKKGVSFSTEKKLSVYISFRNLKNLHLGTIGGTSSNEKLNFTDLKLKNQSVGAVNLDMSLQNLNLENESVGRLKISGKAENAVIRTNSVGSIQAGEFVVQKMDVNNNGIGSVTVNAEKELKVKESSLGRVVNRGSATAKRVNKVVI